MAAETPSQQVPPGIWASDPIHSTINFAISHNGIAAFRSGFRSFDVELDGGEHPQLTGSVALESIEIEQPQQKGFLLSPAFFNADEFPRLRFASTDLSVAPDGTLRLEGDLEVHGVTQRIEGGGRLERCADLEGHERIGLSLTATIDRREFGLDFNAELPAGGNALAWDVEITAELELIAQ